MKALGRIPKFVNMTRYASSIMKFGNTSGSSTGDFERGNKIIQQAYEKTNMRIGGKLHQVIFYLGWRGMSIS